MKKILKVLFKILKIVFIVFISIYLLFLIVHKISVSSDIFGYRIYTINDNTMANKYVINDVVLVKRVNVKKLNKKDNIAYYSSLEKNKVVFHKIIDIKNDKDLLFETKGINSLYVDPLVNNKKVIGKVVGVIPVVSIINRILKNPIGFFLLIFLPLVIIILDQIFKTVKSINMENELIVLGMIEEKKKKKKSVLEQEDGEIEIL